MAPMGYPEYGAQLASPFQQPLMQIGAPSFPRPPPRVSVNSDLQHSFRPPPPSMQYQQQRVCERNSNGLGHQNSANSVGKGFSHSAPTGYSHQAPLASQGNIMDPRLSRGQPRPTNFPPSTLAPPMPRGISAPPRGMNFPRPPPLNSNQASPNYGNYGYGGDYGQQGGYDYGHQSPAPGLFNLQQQLHQGQHQHQQRNYPLPPRPQQQRQSRDPRRR